jgi:hypothetical protein
MRDAKIFLLGPEMATGRLRSNEDLTYRLSAAAFRDAFRGDRGEERFRPLATQS